MPDLQSELLIRNIHATNMAIHQCATHNNTLSRALESTEGKHNALGSYKRVEVEREGFGCRMTTPCRATEQRET